jgi:uncharacterized protein (DUF2267 family)
MSATGLDVFDKTLQTTNRWLGEIESTVGPDRQIAWHVLGAVLRTLRDRLTIGLAAHLGAQLPLIVHGLYYDEFQPAQLPATQRSADEFLGQVSRGLTGIRPVNVVDATKAVFGVLNHYVDPNEIAKVRDALPEEIRRLWEVEPAVPNARPRAETRPIQAVRRPIAWLRGEEKTYACT